MDEKAKINKREDFLRAYSNLPLSARREIILVLREDGPITWEVAYLEVKNTTPTGEKILEQLHELKII
jgi:hypothetical protein